MINVSAIIISVVFILLMIAALWQTWRMRSKRRQVETLRAERQAAYDRQLAALQAIREAAAHRQNGLQEQHPPRQAGDETSQQAGDATTA